MPSTPRYSENATCGNAAKPPISDAPNSVYATISENPDIMPSGRPRPWLTNVYMPPAERILRHIWTYATEKIVRTMVAKRKAPGPPQPEPSGPTYGVLNSVTASGAEPVTHRNRTERRPTAEPRSLSTSSRVETSTSMLVTAPSWCISVNGASQPRTTYPASVRAPS